MKKTQPNANSRRPALRRIATVLLTLTAIGGGLFTWGSHRPIARLASSACKGSKDVQKRILITYASRAGSTGEIAKSISEAFCSQGFDAQVLPVSSVTSLDGYHAVVLGSAVRCGAWLPEMNSFIDSHKVNLSRIPVALFTTHMQALNDTEQSRTQRANYSKLARETLKPRTEAFFAGKIDPATLSFFERMAVKMVKSEIGDKRDWLAIRRWAQETSALLNA
jgi:menaquinone-dependent protoporphyrinogen oxidase